MAADYILKEGEERVILCERGIRTFETATRFTLDVGAVPWLKLHTHLPVIIDPSHAAGHPRPRGRPWPAPGGGGSCRTPCAGARGAEAARGAAAAPRRAPALAARSRGGRWSE